MKAIITGATGFIGKALCRELLQNRCDVIAVVRNHTSKTAKLAEIQAEAASAGGSLQIFELPLDDLPNLSREHHIKADVFYHLAWNGSAGTDREDFDIQLKNISYTANAIRTAKAAGCRAFIGAGSQAEYGVVHELSREYGTLPQPFMMYGAAKLATCQMGKLLAAELGLSFVWPRIFSVYGVGENPGTMVNYVVESLKKGETPELSPCENLWNFLYISDCARALRILGHNETSEGIYHIASEDTRPLKAFVEEIRDIISPGSPIRFGARQSDPARTAWLNPDISRIKALGFVPEVSFAEGIRRKVSWNMFC